MIHRLFGLAFLFLLITNLLNGQETLENILSADRLPYLKSSRLLQISSFDSTGGNNDRINLHPGEKATIAQIQGPGVITHIWVTIDSRDPYFLRRIVLRMFWDGEANPSVEVPIGDFFGTGFEYRHYFSAYVGMTSGGYFSNLPMPFQKSARIEVDNQTGQELYAFYYHIDYQKLAEPLEEDVAYFHCQWRRELRTDPKQNYVVLEAEGQGHFVGLNMSMQSYERNLSFLEGDEMVYVDGETFPSIYGTGTEDYFISGWYFNRGEFAAPYHGLILKDDSLGRIAAYRWHVSDAIPFQKSLRFTIEHGHANSEVADYSSTAYWYQKEPHKAFAPLPAAALRIPLRATVPNGVLEGESLMPQSTNLKAEVEDMSIHGPEWSSLRQLKVHGGREGDSFSISLPVEEDLYSVRIYYTSGPDYGNVNVLSQGALVGKISAYSQQVLPGRELTLAHLKASKGQIPLTFIIDGKDGQAAGYEVGLDAFLIEPEKKFIPEWLIIGPFPNPRESDVKRFGLDTVYAPEKEIEPEKIYSGAEGQRVRWSLEKTPESGYFSLYKKFTPYEFVVAYAFTYVRSPKDQVLPLLLGSDDGVKVFLNDKEVHRFLGVRVAVPDQDRVMLPLKKGWNKLLIKIENNFGGYAFYARIVDLDQTLEYSVKRQ